MPEVLSKLFSINNGDIYKEAIADILSQLEEIHDFFANKNEHEIRGASIFLVICPK